MLNFFYLLFFFSFINAQEKFCVNCRHYKGDFWGGKFGKCAMFPEKDDNQADYLVTGRPHSMYYYCSTARKYDNMCGPGGKYYDKKCNLLDIILKNYKL